MNLKRNYLFSLLLIVFFLLTACNKNEPVSEGSLHLNTYELSIASDSSSSTVVFVTLDNLEGEIIWSSSDPSIATVTADANDPTVARVQGLKPGIVLIKVSVGDYYKECKVTVEQGEFLKVSSTKIDLSIDKTEVIHVESHVSTVTFSSSNNEIATVSPNGLVTAIAEGSAIITVKAGTKTVYVTVVVDTPAIEFADEDDLVMQLSNNPTATLSVVSKGGVDISKGTWSIDDDTVAKITVEDNNLLIEALETGVSRSTLIRFNLPGYQELVKKVIIKDIDLTLTLSPLTGTFLFNDSEFKLNATLSPVQEGERAEIIWESSPSGIVNISKDGTITRNESYSYTDDEVLVTVTATSAIDPEAKKAATILVENPQKGIKFITDLESFNKVMASASRDAEIYLMADIDLEGKIYPGAIMANDFNGHFHGNGHKIHNFTAAGVFGSISGTVENLAISGTMVGSQRGFLAFHITENANVKNLLIDVTFKKPSSYVSGLGLNGKASNVIVIANNPDGIPMDQVYGGFVQVGTGTNVIFYNEGNNINAGGSGILKVTNEQLKASGTYNNFDTDIWNIKDGAIPTLIIQSKGE